MERISNNRSGDQRRPMTATLREKDDSSFNQISAARQLKVFRTKIMKQF
jgi:hypothetical protein